MRNLFIVICSLLPFASFGQYAVNYLSSKGSTYSPLMALSEQRFSSYSDVPGSGKRHKGTAMIIVGSALFTSGAILFGKSDGVLSIYLNEKKSNGTIGAADEKAEAGLVLMVAGVGLIVPGIIIYSKGKKLEKNATATLHLNGAGVTMRFKF